MFAQRKRSPLPSVRRLAGQSLRDERERLVTDHLPLYVFAPAMIWFVVILQFQQEWSGYRLPATFWLNTAIVATGAAAIGYLRLIPKARNLVRGERGELKVAEALEELRSHGYRVFHDIVRDGFNIDHVAVGPAGVFAIETKCWSGRGTINFRNGEGLFMNDKPFVGDRDPVAQARGNAAEVRKLIKQNCGLHHSVTALLVCVGEWKVKESWLTTDARVLSEAQLGRFFERQDQPELTRSEIALIASHLERSAKA